MKFSEYTYKPEFLNIIFKHIRDKNLTNVYNINLSSKYSLNYMTDVVIAISTKTYSRYRLPDDIAEYLHKSPFSRFSKTSLKNLIRSQHCDSFKDNTFFSTYVVIGHDVPVSIKELSVIIEP